MNNEILIYREPELGRRRRKVTFNPFSITRHVDKASRSSCKASPWTAWHGGTRLLTHQLMLNARGRLSWRLLSCRRRLRRSFLATFRVTLVTERHSPPS